MLYSTTIATVIGASGVEKFVIVLLRAVSKDCEVGFLQVGNDLAALLVIDDRVDVDDLSRDRHFLDVLGFGRDDVRRKRILRLAWFRCFAWVVCSSSRLWWVAVGATANSPG